MKTITFEQAEQFEFLDRCAIEAMNSLIANEKGRIYQSAEQVDKTPNRIAEQAYKQAEEMLKVRLKIRM